MASNFSASGKHVQDTSILTVAEDQTLRIQTKFVDKIEKFGSTCDALGDWQNAPDVLRQWMEMVGLEAEGRPQDPPTISSKGDILWRTIMNNSIETDNKERLAYRPATQDDYYSLKKLWDLLLMLSLFISGPLKLDLDSHDKLQIEGSTTIYHVVVCLLQRQLFVTERGMIGLASGDIKIGDEVHILLGCQTPFILRSSEEASSWDLPLYTVIGNGYVHQVTYGEAFDNAEFGPVQSIVLE
ncbi:heterokaryon incompatibility [Fusarium sporotrichioides]|uniref:Heterokaryon incompatibility n=1 Tax=Fusarium sporotrichioides TaxID=5514 RepID=A0A395SDD8_FUSSP|nr:heterokaryon incompatibility [Fusarium sporotrichioides]